MSEIDDLRKILDDGDFYALCEVGDEVDGFATVDKSDLGNTRWESHHTAVTQAPSGAYFKWDFSMGLTEYQDDRGFTGCLVEVSRVERKVTVVEWQPKA